MNPSPDQSAAFGPGLPPAGGWKRMMRWPTYDHEWVSEIINQNNERGRLLIERDQEIERLREALHQCRKDCHAKVIAPQREIPHRG